MIFPLALSMSMDAFSLAFLSSFLYKKKKIKLSLLVGIFHFFMPILGMFFGTFIISFFKLPFFLNLIFLLIGINMVISFFNKKEIKFMSLCLFSFIVSVDSFTLGLGLSLLAINYLIIGCTFFLVSSVFTFLGLILGEIISFKLGDYALLLGGIFLIIYALI